ncbi:hypothetical protein BDF21DRAFT_396275 [Thamnidium elegans]|nr:hypothetical protein BDF21DRAFT_396275 [Thamnidium elegans]
MHHYTNELLSHVELTLESIENLTEINKRIRLVKDSMGDIHSSSSTRTVEATSTAEASMIKETSIILHCDDRTDMANLSVQEDQDDHYELNDSEDAVDPDDRKNIYIYKWAGIFDFDHCDYSNRSGRNNAIGDSSNSRIPEGTCLDELSESKLGSITPPDCNTV